jgi:hypothetical protein
MQSYGRVRREVAKRLVHDADDDADDDDDDDDDDRRAPATWRGHKRAVTGVTLTEDDATAFSVSKDGALVRWDVETGDKDAFPRAPPVTLGIDGGGGGPQARSSITPVPTRPRRRGARRSSRTFPGVSLRPSRLAFNPRRARLDAFQLRF